MDSVSNFFDKKLWRVSNKPFDSSNTLDPIYFGIVPKDNPIARPSLAERLDHAIGYPGQATILSGYVSALKGRVCLDNP